MAAFFNFVLARHKWSPGSYLCLKYKIQDRLTPPRRRDASADEPEQQSQETSMKTILLVDDEADLLTVLAMLLDMEGFHVLTAPDGQRAWQLAQTEPVDLILTDLMMPVMDGLTLCRQLRSDESTDHVPIILNSAGAREPAGAGKLFDVFMTKPASFVDQLAMIRRLLHL
jgi:CheY-like chemotaxis protein